MRQGRLQREPEGSEQRSLSLWHRIAAPAAVLSLTAVAVFVTFGRARPSPSVASTLQSQLPVAPPDPPGTIDGAKNPELIPDNIAYEMLLLSLIEPKEPTELQKARRRAKIGMVRLSQEDAATILVAVGEFRDQLEVINSRVAEIHQRDPIPTPNSTDWQLLAQLLTQKDQLVSNTIAALSGRLSGEGTDKLQGHIWNLKHGIKRFPFNKPATY